MAAHKLTDSYDVAIGGNIPLTTALLLGTQLDNMKVGIDLIDSLNTRKNFIFSLAETCLMHLRWECDRSVSGCSAYRQGPRDGGQL